MKKSIEIVLFCVLSAHAFAQNHNIVGVFPTIDVNRDFNSKWNAEVYSFLAIYPYQQRASNVIYPAKVNSFYSEFDLSYNLTNKLSATASYTYERVNPFLKGYRNENRVWLQLKYKKSINDKLKIENRLRYDFRFISNKINQSIDYKPRVRYRLSLTKSINKNYFNIYNEFFFNTYQYSMFEYAENWFFAGYGYKLTEKTTLEGGLLFLRWIRNEKKDWLNQYFLQLTLYHKF